MLMSLSLYSSHNYLSITSYNKFNKIFRYHNIVLTPQNKFSIKNLLNSKLKDSIPPENKAGIYQINCKDCEKIYIGKTKRNLETRVKEHFRNIKNGEIEKSAIAAHVWNMGYEINNSAILLKSVNRKNTFKYQ